MKKTIIGALAVAIGLASECSYADIKASKTVEPGRWCGSMADAQEYANANNVPLVAVYASSTCGHCFQFENAMQLKDVTDWQAKRKYVMVWGKENTTVRRWIKEAGSITAMPMVRVYWKSNASGQTVSKNFTGFTGLMPVKTGSLQKQFMDSVDQLFVGWNPPGEVNPEKDPEVNPEKDPEVNPEKDPEVNPEKDPEQTSEKVNVFQVYSSPRAVQIVVRNDDGLVGAGTVSLAKISKKGSVKVTTKITTVSGSNLSKSMTLTPGATGSMKGIFTFKSPIGDLPLEIDYYSQSRTIAVSGESSSHVVESGSVQLGGALDADMDELSFTAFFGEEEIMFPDGYELCSEADLPMGEPVYVKKGTKFSCNPAASVKVVKDKETKEYEVSVDMGKKENKTNISGLKLSYTSKSGKLSGSFRVFACNYDGAKPKIKKYTAKVRGLMIFEDGVPTPVIQATVKVGKTSYVLGCSLD